LGISEQDKSGTKREKEQRDAQGGGTPSSLCMSAADMTQVVVTSWSIFPERSELVKVMDVHVITGFPHHLNTACRLR
jgi:hypothetical protein